MFPNFDISLLSTKTFKFANMNIISNMDFFVKLGTFFKNSFVFTYFESAFQTIWVSYILTSICDMKFRVVSTPQAECKTTWIFCFVFKNETQKRRASIVKKTRVHCKVVWAPKKWNFFMWIWCMCVRAHMCMCTLVWKPQVHVGCLFLSLSLFLFGRGSLPELTDWLAWPGRVRDQPVSSCLQTQIHRSSLPTEHCLPRSGRFF